MLIVSSRLHEEEEEEREQEEEEEEAEQEDEGQFSLLAIDSLSIFKSPLVGERSEVTEVIFVELCVYVCTRTPLKHRM